MCAIYVVAHPPEVQAKEKHMETNGFPAMK